MATTLAMSASMSRPAVGRTWIVTSRATSDCHSAAAARTSMTAPVVSDARKVMIATTATSARPAMVVLGTIGAWKLGSGSSGSDGGAIGPTGSSSSGPIGSVVDMHAPPMQHEPAGVILIHQRNVVGGDDHRGSGLVELDEQ